MRRREIELKSDIKDVIQSRVKGLLWFLLRRVLENVLKDIISMLRDKWLSEDLEPEE